MQQIKERQKLKASKLRPKAVVRTLEVGEDSKSAGSCCSKLEASESDYGDSPFKMLHDFELETKDSKEVQKSGWEFVNDMIKV